MEIEIIENTKEYKFPKKTPFCCGERMYQSGGTVGLINEDAVKSYRCRKCGQECEDVATN